MSRGIYLENSILRSGGTSSKPPPTTWSSWVENMSKLSALIDESEYIPVSDWGTRCEITRQVSALREDLQKQRERFTALLRLTKEYADRVLSDISEEIQQQSSLLDSLERRLDMAQTLRQEVVHLRNSYEVGTLDRIKKLRRTGV
jgi:predicted RNase H-like nuclease (RuvC/YqgF family)